MASINELVSKVNNLEPSINLTRKELIQVKGVSLKVVKKIVLKLEQFEKREYFLHHNMSLHKLAKKCKTNPTYISKVINTYKNKNFNTYINDLRIAYTVCRLQQDKKLRNYTIKAIASEVGFKNADSFSSAFRKKTGLYPSHFIKQLNRVEKKISVNS